MPEDPVGVVTHYFAKISVAALKLTGRLKVGDRIHFKGATTDFTQFVDSMQIENDTVEEAGPGDEVGIKVEDRVREHDGVLLVTP